MAAREGQSDGPPAPATGADGGPIEAAAYISEAVAELAELARRHRLHMLGHLLEMAQLEASETIRSRITP